MGKMKIHGKGHSIYILGQETLSPFNVGCFASSMITVVEFSAKQATGSRYMPTDKLYTNYFFIKIDLNCF
jgi:hypothetical protein